MDATDLNCELDACRKYLDEAEKVINMLKLDIDNEVAKYRLKVIARVAGAASVAIVGGGTQIIF